MLLCQADEEVGEVKTEVVEEELDTDEKLNEAQEKPLETEPVTPSLTHVCNSSLCLLFNLTL